MLLVDYLFIHLFVYFLLILLFLLYIFIHIHLYVVLYRCAVHVDCDHLLRVDTERNLEGGYNVYECGQHNVLLGKTQNGIHPSLVEEIDGYLRINAAPKKILIELERKYKNTEFFSILPSIKNVRNRKRTVRKSTVVIECLNDLRNFVIDKKVISRTY